MDLKLKGKRAIVTGGSRGIGRAIAATFAREGADVAIGARDQAALEAAADELSRQTGAKIVPIPLDVSEDASVEAFVGQAAAALGGIDILVNNAGAPGTRKAAKVEQIDNGLLLEDFNLKLCGSVRMAAAAIPHMLRDGWGRVINIGGLGSRVTGNYMGGMRTVVISTLSKNLADEFGRRGITANTIHPGFIRPAEPSAAFLESVDRLVSIGRPIDHEEIAFLVAMLASPLSQAINGQTIQAGGGLLGGIDY